jgi:nucleoside-diphosphate kinase
VYKLEQSLVLIKPDSAIRRRVSALVLDALLAKGYKIEAFREMKVPVPLAKKHYAVHKDKPFFGWLVDFITSARVLAMVFGGDNVIQGIRDALGATFVQKAIPDSLRGRYGIWAGINVAHASDAPDTAAAEIALWTKEGGLVQSADAEAKARAYITKYKAGDADYTADLRKLVRTAIEQKRSSPNLVPSLEKLFSKDAEGVHQSEISALARSIQSFIKDEIAKA